MSNPWLILIVSLIGCAILLATTHVLRSRWGRRLTRRQYRRRAHQAQRGEHEAEKLLARHGYRVVGRQVRRPWVVRVDGHDEVVTLRVDLVARRGARRYLVEAKTGAQAGAATTRRQLLEYQLAFGRAVHGVLLADMQACRLQRVEFPSLGRRTRPWWAVALAAAALVALWVALLANGNG